MKIKQVRFILGFLALLLLFQNCGGANSNSVPPPKDVASGTSTQGSKTPSSSSGPKGINSGRANSISRTPSSGGSFGGISSGSAGAAGSGGAGVPAMGSGSGGSTGGTCLGCSGGGATGTGVIGSGNVTFRISSQPISKTLDEGGEFNIGVSVQGGQGPYTFKWYRNGEEIPGRYGLEHFESYSDILDRIYKEGDYHVVVKDKAGSTLTSNKAQIRMSSKICGRGNYFIDLSVRTNTADGYYYFNDLFYYKTNKYLVSQNNPTISQMQLNNFVRYLNTIGFSYFTINQDISNGQQFILSCSTDIPTIHSSECASNSPEKCGYDGEGGYNGSNNMYEGGITFNCRNGYIEFVSNSCRLVQRPVQFDNND